MSADLCEVAAAEAGPLRAVIEGQRRLHGLSLQRLTVLRPKSDPYRLDTPAGHTVGRWLVEAMGAVGVLDRAALAAGVSKTIHLRGTHYALVSTEGLLKPDGKPYRNTEDDWVWVSEYAAKCARWLGYLPFEAITDARNSAPVIYRSAVEAPVVDLIARLEVETPDVVDLTPRAELLGFEGRQAVHLVLFGEKTSLEPILLPLARRYAADLYLPAGEISDTLLYQMARDGDVDGRPMVVLVFADCDPAGYQMAVSIARKLQGLRDLFFPELEFEVHPVALTVAQVGEHDLPSTPLKETEKRASAWKRAYGVEQTEIDALAALKPDVLRYIAHEAIRPFYDATLAGREAAARRAWEEVARAIIAAEVDPTLVAALEERGRDALDAVNREVAVINAALWRATLGLRDLLPEPAVPEPLPFRPGRDGVLVSTPTRTWLENTRAMQARKAYAEGADGAPPEDDD